MVRNTWNKHIALPGSAFAAIPDDGSMRWKARSWGELPDGLRNDVEAWLTYFAKPDIEDDREPLRSRTLNNYRGAFRRFCSRLIDNGVPIERFTSLTSVLEPDLIKQGLRLIELGREAEAARCNQFAAAAALLSAAKYINATRPDKTFEEGPLSLIRKLSKRVCVKRVGMTKKNRERLIKLRDPVAARMFRNLHITVAARYREIENPTRSMAQKIEIAAIHALLQEAPLRAANVCALDLDRHIIRPAGGVAGRWRIFIPAAEMKAGRDFETALGTEASAYLDEYLSRYRPLISKKPTTVLFPTTSGKAKTESSLSTQYSNFIRRELGLKVNPHLLRHHAGMQWLDHMPGQYEALSKLLGHSSAKTTQNFYTGAEALTAQDRYHQVLEVLRTGDREQPVLRRSRRNHRREAAE